MSGLEGTGVKRGLAFHARLGFHLLQLVFEVSDHLVALLHLTVLLLARVHDLLLQLPHAPPTFLLSDLKI